MRALRPVCSLAATATLLLSACGVESQTFVDVPPAVTRPTLVPPPLPTTTYTQQETTTTVVETTTTPLPPPIAVALPKPVTSPRDTRGAEVRSDLGTIEIPKIGLRMTMLEGIRLTTLDQGPGHWPGSAMPGQIGNVVVAGHRTSHAKPFRHLDALNPGDEVIFTMPNGQFVYRVVSTEIVSPDRVDIVDQTSARTGTLFACHPPGSTKERIVVHLVYSG